MTSSTLDPALLKRLQELSSRCKRQQQVISTDFLDAETVARIRTAHSVISQERTVFSGGYDGAERQALFFLPDWLEKDAFLSEDSLHLLKITPAEPTGLSHRDYLGSLLSLGIRREKTGDILVQPDHAQLIVFPELIPYLTSNLTHIGRTSARVEEIPFSALTLPEKHTTTFTRTVASLRCDSVLSAAFSLSRGDAAEAMKKGLVSIDHLPEEKPDRPVKSGCLLVVRGMGRARMETEQTQSRKGRIFIRIIREE